MSKDRQRRRAARQAAAAKNPSRPSTTPRAPGRGRTPKPGRRNRRPTGPLAAERRTQNLLLAAGLLMGNVLLWTQIQGWVGRIVALVLTMALWPVIVTVVFDRKSS